MSEVFTELFPKDLTYDENSRIKKAKKIIAILDDNLGSLSHRNCLDLGCSMGYITQYLGKYFKKVVGVDVDRKAIEKAEKINKLDNVSFRISQENKIPFSQNYFDVIVFNQIYEHVQNPDQLFIEIKRILKPDGICYFGARNKYFILDGHYFFPFLAYLPRGLADLIVKIFWHKKKYDINLYSLKQLRYLTKDFKVCDYTLKVIRYPRKYLLDYKLLNNFNLSYLFYLLGKTFYFLIPNYIWVLEKKK